MVFESDVRPWGSWRVIDRGEGYQVKRIEVSPGHRLSYQTHAQRAEYWLVVAGIATCVLEGEVVEVGPGQSLEVPVGAAHRIGNRHEDPVVLIEVQRGSYLGEDDIERLADDYGRVGGS
jgi:mannose-6-phosphate isomerase-like protein (cupin superfamily)